MTELCQGRPGSGRVWVWIWLGCVLAGLLLFAPASSEDRSSKALLLTIDGSIGPATLDYLERGLGQAAAEDASLVVIQLDTPGGLASSMRSMIKAILASPVPVVTWVAPAGARAASAGTYLLYGSHVAAMAPATHLGSATPVQMGGFPGGSGDTDEGETDNRPATGPGSRENNSESNSESTGENAGESAGESAGKNAGENVEESAGESAGKRRGGNAMERKVLEDAVAYIRSLAERHDRNADWAEQAVREAVNLSANEAESRNVVDLVAADLDALLQALDGRTVQMADGERTLETSALAIHRFDPDWRTDLLSVITDPNVAYFLMIIGFYGLIFELASPGAMVPGVIGAICLVLALFAFQVLTVNYAGLALIILGLAFIVGETLVPSFGALGLGGIVAFVVGSIILMDGTNQAISWPIIGGTAAIAAGFMLWTVTRLMGLRRRPATTGRSQMLGALAKVTVDFQQHPGESDYRGKVFLHGETWRATSGSAISEGTQVRVIAIRDLEVRVEPTRE